MLAPNVSANCPALLVTPLMPPPWLLNEPLAPLLGAAKLTLTPGTTLPNGSVTVATSAFVNAVLTVALWPVPEVTAIVSLVVWAVFVRLKLAGLVAPTAVAVTI